MAEIRPNHDLLQRALAGDRDAGELLLEQYRMRLRGWIRTRIGSGLRGKLEIEDVLQDCFSKAWESLREFEYRGEDTLFRWLCSIAERVVLKAAERERKKPLLTLRHEVEARRASPSQAMRRGERFDRLQRALDRLRPEYRQVILQARIEGLPINEIAARTGRSPGAVSMLLSRALQKLKEAFGDTESLSLPEERLENQGREASDDVERG